MIDQVQRWYGSTTASDPALLDGDDWLRYCQTQLHQSTACALLSVVIF